MTDFRWQLPTFDHSDKDFKRYISENSHFYTGDEESIIAEYSSSDCAFMIAFDHLVEKLGLDSSCQLALTSHQLTYPSKLHFHDYLEIPYLAQGSMLHIVKGRPHIMEEGSFCLVPQQTAHLIAPLGDEPPVIVNFLISQPLLAKIAELTKETAKWTELTEPIFMDSNQLNPIIRSQIERLILDYFQADYTVTLSTLAGILNLFDYTENNSNKQRQPLDRLSLACLQLIKEKPSHITQAALAQELHYSPGYLSRHIKKTTGQTISQLIAEEKLTLAQQLLLNTDWTIRAIAEEAGYQSESHFHRLFKEKNAITPAQYRTWMTQA